MAIVLARVDDRVIHGQTMTRWVKQKPVDSLVVISDVVAADELRRKVLKAAAGNLKLGIYTVEQGVAALEKVQASSKRFYIISDSIKGFADLLRLGANFGDVLNIGNYNSARKGTRNLGKAFLLNEEDVVELDYLSAHGIDIQFQPIPDDVPAAWSAMRSKWESLA